MSSLIYLEAPNVLHNLGCRYDKGEIYTSISKVLIAVNPYKELDVYGPDVIRKYRQAAADIKRRLKNDLPPHVFTVAQTSYFNLLKLQINQSMIVCGESGSGKTESAKHLMRYLAASSKGDVNEEGRPSIENQVLDANPILESFGNAKTVLNNNSSRFGKFTKIVFQSDLIKIAGSFIETYLLEKSRVTKQDLNERNYHIFYMLCRAHNQLPYGANFELGNKPEAFHYLNQSGTTVADGINDEEKMQELLGAMRTLSISEQDQVDVFGAVAGVLHLGNIKLVADQKDLAVPAPEANTHMDAFVKLFGVKKEMLYERLTTRKIKVGKELISKQLSLADGLINRESFGKALYAGVFQWVVNRINFELYKPESRDPNLKWIGILDVFGFESFEHNSFEQFCINFANERLQQYFNGYILLSEQEEYLAEAIQWVPLKVPNNQDVIDLIDRKPNGILAVLDSECMMPKSTSETFIQNLFKVFRFHKRMAQVRRVTKAGVQGFTSINGFSIVHYAGKVIYNADDFLVKNNDAPSPENVELVASSTSSVIRSLLDVPEEDEAKKSKGGLKSTGSVFSKQLESLMNTLQPTTPYFVRCIKPNPLKKPGIFDWKYTRPQLECGGIIEALRILKCGYPTRCTYDDIFDRYGHILNPTPPKLNKRDFCEAVLRCCGTGLDRSEFQLGLSKCFFRPGKQEFLEELLQGPELTGPTIMAIKRFLLNKRFQRARGAITAHIGFTFILRRMRAELKVKRVFSMASIISSTFVASLAEQRQAIAAVRMQAAARAILEHKFVLDRKHMAGVVTAFYQHNVMRKKLQVEVDKRIQAKAALLSEREKQRKAQLEIEKREARKREAEAKEQARLDAIKAKQEEEEARAREEIEKVQREKEERERKIREIEEQEQDLRRRAEQALAGMAEVEALKATLLEQEQQMKLREEEFAKKEKRLALAADTRSDAKFGVDALAQLIQNGAIFQCGKNSPESQSLGSDHVFVQVNAIGELCWYKPDEKAVSGEASEGKQADQDWDNLPSRERNLTEYEQSRTQLGQLSLLKVRKIIAPPPAEDSTTCYFLVLGEGSVCLDFQLSDISLRNKWRTCLRYAVRNMAELGTVSRPIADQQRGNWICAELKEKIQELTEKILTQLDNAPLASEKQFLEQELSMAETQISELKARNDELEQELAETRNALQEEREARNMLPPNELKAFVDQEMKAVNCELASLGSSNQMLQDEVFHAQMNQLKARNRDLEDELEAAHALKLRIAELEKEKREAEIAAPVDPTAFIEASTELRLKNQELANELSMATKALEQERELARSTDAEVRQRAQELQDGLAKTLEQERGHSKRQAELVAKAMEDRETQLKEYVKEQLTTVQTQLAEFKVRNQTLQDELEATAKFMEEQRLKRNETRTTHEDPASLISDKEMAERELMLANARMTEIQSRNHDLKNELEVAAAIKLRCQALEEQLEASKKAEVLKLVTEQSQTGEREQKLNTQVATLTAKNKELEERIHASSARHKALEHEIEKQKNLPSEKQLKQFIERELNMVQTQISELKTRNKKLQEEADGAASLKKRVKELEAQLAHDEDKGGEVVIHTGKPLDLASQVEELKRDKKLLQEELEQQRQVAPLTVVRQTTRRRVTTDTQQAAIHADRMKFEEMEEKNLKIEQENQELKQRLADMENAGSRGQSSVTKTVDAEVQRYHDAQQKALAAKKAISLVENKVLEAEEKVKKRQDTIRNVMRQVNERDKELQTTISTMEVLGINEGGGDDMTDETAKKLTLLKAEQKAKQTEAKQLLMKNHEELKRETDAMNEAKAELSKQNLTRAENEKIQEDLAAKHRKGQQRRNSREKGADDGCVLS